VKELPFETYERMTGRKWPGGKSLEILQCLAYLRIRDKPGSAAANLKLQEHLLAEERRLQAR
jgi:hypothetical protein